MFGVGGVNMYHTHMVAKKKQNKNKSKSSASHYIHSINETNEKFYITSLLLGTTKNCLPNAWIKCKASVQETKEDDLLILEFEDNLTACVKLMVDSAFVLKLVKTCIFSIKLTEEDENVTIHLYFTQLPLKKFNTGIGQAIKDVFTIGFEDISFHETDDETPKSVQSIDNIYKSIRTEQSAKIVADIPKFEVQSCHLKPTLRPYQENSVRWMIYKESLQDDSKKLHPSYRKLSLSSGLPIYLDIHTGYVDLEEPLVGGLKTGGILADEMGLGKTVEVLACVLYDKKVMEDKECDSSKTEGVDEPIPMVFSKGKRKAPEESVEEVEAKKMKVVGKRKADYRVALNQWYEDMLKEVNYKHVSNYNTEDCVECICGKDTKNLVIKCGDCNKRQHSTCMGYENINEEYYCPQCWLKKPALKSNATLIVCPLSLLNQWTNEICKHVRSGLSILQYNGTQSVPVYPTELAKYDIVIITYNILQAELRQHECNQIKKLRRKIKYAQSGSPILLIEWRRLCFDEAQLLETGLMISEMASKLVANHRWAITGTPISKNLLDLHPLIKFLQVDAYTEEKTWIDVLYNPYQKGNIEPMIKFLAEIMWRTQKRDVLDQINIPPQSIQEYKIEFSAIEKYYYDKELELCTEQFLQNFKNYQMNTPLSSLNKSLLKHFLTPVLAIRQVCAHHGVAKGRYLLKKSLNSMQELLDALVAKNIAESEECLRLIISSLNGAAGINILMNKPQKAIDCYKQVLITAEEYSKGDENSIKLSIDKLQLIHALHNLSEIIVMNPDVEIDDTLKAINLGEKCVEIQRKYLQKFESHVTNSIQINTKLANDLNQLIEQLQLKPGQWSSAIIELATSDRTLYDDIVNRISAALDSNGYDQQEKVYRNLRGMLYSIRIWEDNIDLLRSDTTENVNSLYDIEDNNIKISSDLVVAAAECHLRPTDKKKKKKLCKICETNMLLKDYEAKLFYMTMRAKEDDQSNKGNWKPALEEQYLRSLLQVAKLRNLEKLLVQEGDIVITIYDIYKKEFKEVRKLWTNIDQLVCAYDEVDMCVLRMSLKIREELPEENKCLKNLSYAINNPLATINQIEEHELEYQLSKVELDSAQASRDIKKYIGIHKYLQTLHMGQHNKAPDPCPICKNDITNKWHSLKCGHCYCIDCMHKLTKRSGNVVICSICRNKQTLKDINYVELKENSPEKKSDIKGNCSSKFEAIIQLIKTLRKGDENVKILIFSTWVQVLKLIHILLGENEIKSELFLNQNNQKNLKEFQSSENVTVLLLPIKFGSKGLNITEATHIIFVEPLLDPADELQAVGRVHRIGQTKATTVHKFIMKNTIEENIHNAISANSDEWDSNKVTLQQIKTLFVTHKQTMAVPTI